MKTDDDLCVATYIFRNPSVYSRHREDFLAYPFGDPFLAWIYQVMDGVWDRDGRFPAPTELSSSIRERGESLPPDHLNVLLEYAHKLGTYDVTHVSRDLVADYLMRRRVSVFSSAIEEGGGAVDDALQILQDIRSIKESHSIDNSSLRSPFGKEALQRLRDNPDGEAYVPLGYPELDARLRGGARRGEFVLLVIPTGRGKSLFMISTAVGMVKKGYRVLYIVLDNPREEMEIRMMESALGVSHHDFPSRAHFAEEVEGGLNSKEIWGSAGDPEKHIIVRTRADFSKSPSPEDILRLTRDLESDPKLAEYDRSRGLEEDRVGKFDAVFLDYPDKMSVNREPGRTYSAKWETLATIFEDIQALAICLDRPVIGVSQVNRSGLSSEEVRLDSIAGSSDKTNPPGVIGLFGQTPAEERASVFRLNFVKTRRGGGNFNISFKSDPSICRVTEVPESSKDSFGANGNTEGTVTRNNRTRNRNREYKNREEYTQYLKTQKQGLNPNPAIGGGGS